MQDEIVHADAVAQVQRRVVERAQWLREQPLAIDPELWHEARQQLLQILEARGWPLAQDNALYKANIPHFLLHGVPIVMGD